MRLLLLSLGLFLIGFTNVSTKQQKYLPVYISILDTSNIPPAFLLSFKAAFGTRKIKTLSKQDVESLIHSEISALAMDYVRNGGDLADFERYKNYQASNMRSVGNNLTLSIKIDANGIINDTVKWDAKTFPVNMVNPHKTKWHYTILNSSNAGNVLQMTQSIVDSIIASNVLAKE